MGNDSSSLGQTKHVFTWTEQRILGAGTDAVELGAVLRALAAFGAKQALNAADGQRMAETLAAATPELMTVASELFPAESGECPGCHGPCQGQRRTVHVRVEEKAEEAKEEDKEKECLPRVWVPYVALKPFLVEQLGRNATLATVLERFPWDALKQAQVAAWREKLAKYVARKQEALDAAQQLLNAHDAKFGAAK